MEPKLVAPGLLLYEYSEDEKMHILVGVVDTTINENEEDEVSDFMNGGTIKTPVKVI